MPTAGSKCVAVVTALMKLSRDIADDPAIWIDAMAGVRPDIPRENFESLAAAYEQSWSVNGGMSARSLAFTADWNFKGADFEGIAPVDLDAWVDFSVVDEALVELGTVPELDPVDR